MQISGIAASAKTQSVAYFNKRAGAKEEQLQEEGAESYLLKLDLCIVHLGGLKERGFLLSAVESPCLQEMKDP